jgi:hypothetical protein
MDGTEIRAAINRQRVKHIVSSYHLDEPEPEVFGLRLEALLDQHPAPLIELALVETLADSWVHVPPIKGLVFLEHTQSILNQWQEQPIFSTLTPEQFQQITGLDPAPVFGSNECPSVSLRQPS